MKALRIAALEASTDALREYDESVKLLHKWLNFASDVQTSCPAGQDELDMLRDQTYRLLTYPNGSTFTKADLRDWMVVQFTNNQRGVVHTGANSIVGSGWAYSLSIYGDTLQVVRPDIYPASVEIVKVFAPVNLLASFDPNMLLNPGRLLWTNPKKNLPARG